MNKKIQLSALFLAAVTPIGFMLPQEAAARERRADDRRDPPKFAHYDRERHHYRHQHRHQRHHYRHPPHRPVPRWYRHYQRHHAYGHYRPWRRHPGFLADRRALKKHYRRMERHHRRHHRHAPYPHRGYSDSNIHFRIDYWN